MSKILDYFFQFARQIRFYHITYLNKEEPQYYIFEIVNDYLNQTYLYNIFLV